MEEVLICYKFFYGASKGNPGITGARDLIISPDRVIESCFSWGLGVRSNNQAECLSFLKSCQYAKEIGYMSIQIYGYLELLIKLLNSEDQFNNSTLNSTLQRIRNSLKEFEVLLLIIFCGI